MERVYLDHNATTAPDPRVVEGMLPFLTEHFHNPSSPYPAASLVADAIEAARGRVARLLGVRRSAGVVFTSGGSESINCALFGAAALRPGGRVVSSTVEHSATKGALSVLAKQREWRQIAVDREGRLERAALFDAIDSECALVSLMLANNETGVLTDLAEVGEACRAAGALLHIDAVQGPGKIELGADEWQADLISLAAHKFHGPKGVGALWIRPGLELEGLVRGGPQEHGLRAGTENVPGIIGMGIAAELARERGRDRDYLAHLKHLREGFESTLLNELPGTAVQGGGARRVVNTSNVHVPGADARAMLLLLAEAGIEASAGSACNAQASAPSPVLLAMGRDELEASCSLRFSSGPSTTEEQMQRAARAVLEASRVLASLA